MIIVGTLKHTTSHENQSKFSFPEATSTSYNTTDSSGSGYRKFEDDEEIDRTRITDVFILIIGKTIRTAMFTLIAVQSADHFNNTYKFTYI